MTVVPARFLRSVVETRGLLQNDEFGERQTGFFYRREEDGTDVFVTCLDSVRDRNSGRDFNRINVAIRDENFHLQDVEIGLYGYGAARWRADENTRVAVVLVEHQPFEQYFIGSSQAWTTATQPRPLQVGEPILTLGFPDIEMLDNREPLVRAGVIARLNDSALTVLFSDSRSLDGDEGGPAILQSWPFMQDQNLMVRSPVLIGVVVGHQFVERPDYDGNEHANLTWIAPMDVVDRLITELLAD